MNLKTYFIETRPQFLILAVILGFLGTTIASFYGSFNLGYAILATLGLVLAHASVNTFNDYFDYRSGVDLATHPTPFSGGSGILSAGALKPQQVLRLALGSFLVASAIGIYFVFKTGWQLLPLLLAAGLLILLYTRFILCSRFPEWAAGLGLGILPVLGAYFVQTSAYVWPAVVASVPSGILVYNLLFLNEFPDLEPDKVGSRQTTPILIGNDKSATWYAVTALGVYVWIAGWVMVGVMPAWCLLALLTLPFTVKAIQGARNHRDMGRLVPALANNVLAVLLTQALLGAGYILAAVL